MVSPSARRRAARYLVKGGAVFGKPACRALKVARSIYYRKAADNQSGVRLEKRIKALSRKHRRYGYRMITQLLRQEGWSVNRKRVQRLRRQEGL